MLASVDLLSGPVPVSVVRVPVDADIVVALDDGNGGRVILVPSVLRDSPEERAAVTEARRQIADGALLAIIPAVDR